MEKSNLSKKMKISFWFFTIILPILAIADVGLTYIGTPDLAGEANPLITVYGLGWPSLIMAQVIGYAICLFFAYNTFISHKRSVIFDGKGFRQYTSTLLYGSPDYFVLSWFMLPLKKNGWACYGYATLMTLIIARVVVIFEWIEIIYDVRTFRIPGTQFYIGVYLIFLFFLYSWTYKEYRINKKELEKLDYKQSVVIKDEASKKAQKVFWFFVLIYPVLSVADHGLKYIGTLDLSMEVNPFVFVLRIGQSALTVSNMLGYLIYLSLINITYISYKRSVIFDCNGYKQFASTLLYGSSEHFALSLLMPPFKKSGWAAYGFAAAMTIIVIRSIVIFEQIGLMYDVYNFRMPNLLFYIIVYPVFMIFLNCWFYKEYRINKKELK